MKQKIEERPLFCRGYIEPKKTYEETEKRKNSYNYKKRLFFPLRFVFDTETTTDQYQNLRIGYFELHSYKGIEMMGLFHSEENTLSKEEIKTLKEYGIKNNITVYSLTQFIEEAFIPCIYKEEALCIGANLPFDVTRLCNAAIPSENAGLLKDDILLSLTGSPGIIPNIRYGRMGLAETLTFTDMGDVNGQIKPFTDKLKTKGYFIDIIHLYSILYASGTEKFPLEYICNELKTKYRKIVKDKNGNKIEHGKELTDEYINYLINDVKATYSAYEELEKTFMSYNLDNINATQLFSAASLGKAIFKQLGIKPFLECEKEILSYDLGRLMQTYYGGRVECKLRRTNALVEFLDFTSQYPSVIILTGLWKFIISDSYKQIAATEEIRNFVDSLTLNDMLNPDNWKKLPCICKIIPNNDILPFRTGFKEKGEKTVCTASLTSNTPVWYTLADTIQSKLLTGKTPKILEAIRYIPGEPQKSLRSHKILGYDLNPAKDNLIKFFVEERQKLKTEKRDPGKQQALKITANATGYGIFIEVNSQGIGKANGLPDFLKGEKIISHSGDESLLSMGIFETPGKYFNPLIATTITGASRLLLSMAEAKLKEMGFSHYYMDTDSIAVPPEAVEALRDFFQPLNPYKNVPWLLKHENDKLQDRYGEKIVREKGKDGLFYPLQYGMFISSKRYVLFGKDESGLPDINAMHGKLHGLGHITTLIPEEQSNEEKKLKWQNFIWRDLILLNEGVIYDLKRLYGSKYEIAEFNIRTPTTLNWFRAFNKNKPYREQIKPCNFGLRASVKKISDTGEKNEKMFLISPKYNNAQEMVHNPAFDIKNNEIAKDVILYKTLDITFSAYLENEEQKFNGDFGFLERKTIHITDKIIIGKEINVKESYDEILEDLDTVPIFESPKEKLKKLKNFLMGPDIPKNKRDAEINHYLIQIEEMENENNENRILERIMKIRAALGRGSEAKEILIEGEERRKILKLKKKDFEIMGIPAETGKDIKSRIRKNQTFKNHSKPLEKILEYIRKETV